MNKNLFDSIYKVATTSQETDDSYVGDNGDSERATSVNRESGTKSPASVPNLDSTMALASKSDEACVSCDKDVEDMTETRCDRHLTDDAKTDDNISNPVSVPTFNSSMNIWSRLGVESSEYESRSPVFALNSEMPQLVGYNPTEEDTNDRTPPHLSPHIASSVEERDSAPYLLPNTLPCDAQSEKDVHISETSYPLHKDSDVSILDSALSMQLSQRDKDFDQSERDNTCPRISTMTLDAEKKDSNKGKHVSVDLNEESTEKRTPLGPPPLSPNGNIASDDKPVCDLQTKNSYHPNETIDSSRSILAKLDEPKETDSTSNDVQIIDNPSATSDQSVDNTSIKSLSFAIYEGKSSEDSGSAVTSKVAASCMDSFAKQQSSSSTATRHVSFFEKAADFFGTNLIESGDINLSSATDKSVFSALVSDGDVLMKSPESIDQSQMKPSSTSHSQEDVDENETERSSAKVSPSLSSRPSDFLFESCSVNELLMKEEEEEEGKDVSEEASEESGLLDPETSPDSTTKSYLNKVVDMVMPTKAGSQLQTISSRLRTRMPHWDDAFNDAFVPQLRGKSVSSASPGSAHSHASDLSSKRLKNVHSSGDAFTKAHDDDVGSLPTPYRDSFAAVPLHVKKARQYLFSLEMQPRSNRDFDDQSGQNNQSGDECDVTAKVNQGNPVSKYNENLMNNKKMTYHEFKKAIRMPPNLVWYLPAPVIGKVEGVKQPGNAPLLSSPNTAAATAAAAAAAAPLPASPLPTGSAVEFRSSLGAMVRTKARAFTKAALRRQIAEEASTARPHFRVKSRAGPDGGNRSLALVITRVTRPPMKRSLSQSKAGEEEETASAVSAAAAATAPAAAAKADDRQGTTESSKEQADNESPLKRLKEIDTAEDQSVSLSDSYNAVSGERSLDDVDEDDATTPAMSQTTDGGGASTPDIAPALSAADVESPAATESSEKRTEDDVPDSKSHPEDGTSKRTPVNFRGVASNRKRLKKKPGKPRLLAEIENTTGFIMEQNSGNVREQRALQRVLHNLSASEVAPSRAVRAKRKAKAALQSKHKNRWRKAVVKGKREPPGRFRRRQDDSHGARPEIKSESKSPKKSPREKKRPSPRHLVVASRISAKYANRPSRDPRSQPDTPTTTESVNHSSGGGLNALHREVLAVMLLPYRRDHYGRGPLHMAAELGHMESINFCLNSADEMLSNVRCKDFMGLTPLHAAARSDMWSAMIALLDAGADVNAKGGVQNETPLHEAAANGSYQSALILLSRGADRSLRSSDGKTAVDVAKHLEMRELIRKFEEHSKKKYADRLTVENVSAATKDFVFELCDLNFPLIFEVWFDRESRWKEMVLVCEMAEIMCTTIRAILTRFATKLTTVKMTLGELKKSLRSPEMWPAIRFKVLPYFQDSMSRPEEWKDRSLTLVVYSPTIRDLLGGLSFTVTQEEVDAEQEVEEFPPLPRLLTKKEKVERKLARHYQAECEYEYDLKRELHGRGMISPPLARISNVMPAVAPKVKEKVSPPVPDILLETIEASDSSSSESEKESDDDVVITGIFTSSAPKRQRASAPPSASETPPSQSGLDRTSRPAECEKKLPTARCRQMPEEEYLKKCQMKINSARRELELYEQRVSKALSAIRAGEKSDTAFEKAKKVAYPRVDLVDDDELAIVESGTEASTSAPPDPPAADLASSRLVGASSLPSAIFDHDYSQAPAPPRLSPGAHRVATSRSAAPVLSINQPPLLAPTVAKAITAGDVQHSGVPVRTVRVARSSLLPSAAPPPAPSPREQHPVSSHIFVASTHQGSQQLPSRGLLSSGASISRATTNRLIPSLGQPISLPMSLATKSSGLTSPNRSPPVLLAQTIGSEQPPHAAVTPDPIAAPPVLFPQPPVLQPDPQIVDCLSDSEFYGDVVELDADCPPPPLMPCLGVDAPVSASNSAATKHSLGFGVPVVDGVTRKLSQSQTSSVFTSAFKVSSSAPILNRNTCFILQPGAKVMNSQRIPPSAPPILIPEQPPSLLDPKGRASDQHLRPSFGNPSPVPQSHKRFDLSLQEKPSVAKPASALLSSLNAKNRQAARQTTSPPATRIPVRKPAKRAQAVFNSDTQSAKIQRLSHGDEWPDNRVPPISALTKQVKVFQTCREDGSKMRGALSGESVSNSYEKSNTYFPSGGVTPSRPGDPVTSPSAVRKPKSKPKEADFRIDLTELSSPEAS